VDWIGPALSVTAAKNNKKRRIAEYSVKLLDLFSHF
jgi:hypothetical protein